jgi:hypothetical protein
MIELDNGLAWPKALSNLLARDHFAARFQKHSEYLEGLLLEANPATLFSQFAPPEVDLKWAEAHV